MRFIEALSKKQGRSWVMAGFKEVQTGHVKQWSAEPLPELFQEF